jgi:hypothetical protein
MKPASKGARPPYRALILLAFCALYLLHVTGFGWLSSSQV